MSEPFKNPFSFVGPFAVRRSDHGLLTSSRVWPERCNNKNRFADVDEIADRLQYGPIFHGVSPDDLGQVVVVSTDTTFICNLGKILISNKFKWRSSESVSAIFNSDVAIVEIDSLGVIWELIDKLLRIRQYNPQCSVILVSAEFSEDDFGTSRHPICDTSLRRPHSFARLEQAFVEASQNNMIWREKRQSIHCCEPSPT